MYKIVLFPIQVPRGEFCWEFKGSTPIICPHFYSEVGHPICILGFSLQSTSSYDGIKKPAECAKLKDLEERTSLDTVKKGGTE